MSTTWTAGVVKHGSDHKPPTPGAATLVTIESFHGDDLMATYAVTWDGYTPADVTAARVKRWKDTRTRYEVDGRTLTYWGADDRWQRLTLTETTPEGDPR